MVYIAICYNKTMKKILLGVLCVGGLLYIWKGGKPTIINFPNNHQAIVAFGDSLTAGYGATAGSGYPEVLARKINRPVINLGLSGDTAARALERLEAVLREHPYMVLIEFGANDFMRQQSRQKAVESVAYIVEQVQSSGAIAVIVDTGGPGMSEYTKAYKKLAQEKGALFVPGILKGIFFHKKYKSDQVHPNEQGYAKIADKVHKVIAPYL